MLSARDSEAKGTERKVVVVTGAARGIGKNIAAAFGRTTGCRVYICDIDQVRLDQTCREMSAEGNDVRSIVVDLSLPGAAQNMIRDVVKESGRLNALVNNAQSTRRCGFLDETETSWDSSLSVTLKAAFFAAQEAVRVMSRSGGGAIVNIASMSGVFATHESPSYHVAKGGMIQMTRYLAVEAGRYGVRVNCVCPAFIVQDEHRERYDRADNVAYREIAEHCHPLRKVGMSDDVADAVLFLCSPKSTFVNGHTVVLDGGATVQDQFCLLRDFDLSGRKE